MPNDPTTEQPRAAEGGDLKAERNAALAALQELLDASESYAKASLTLSNAEANFSNHDTEAKRHLNAMVRVSNAEKAARALLSNYAMPANPAGASHAE